MVTVVNSVGSRLRVFSKVSDTSAIPAAFREREPLNIRSSRLSDLSDFILCSPITQRIASTIFDLPQPLGPTIPVMGWSSSICVLSANDLKPFISNDFNLKAKTFREKQKYTFQRVKRGRNAILDANVGNLGNINKPFAFTEK
jgi:hypothetical protein